MVSEHRSRSNSEIDSNAMMNSNSNMRVSLHATNSGKDKNAAVRQIPFALQVQAS